MSMEQITAFDLVLAPAILILAAVLLNIRDLFASIVLFIIFSLLMAATWARLGAVDIALAEAAIGAGITGALLLNALGDMAARGGSEPRYAEAPSGVPGRRRLLAGIVVAPVAVILGYAVISTPRDLDVLSSRVEASLRATGVKHDVTGVLMSFRAYDTLLELTVLFLVVVGAWGLRLPRAPRETPPLGVVLTGVGRLVVPAAVLIGGYMLWRGSDGPGGAFQAGAVLAGAAVLWHLGDPEDWPSAIESVANVGLGLGLTVFASVGLVATLLGYPFLFYRGAWAEIVIPTVETAATLSIAIALVSIFIGRSHWESEGNA